MHVLVTLRHVVECGNANNLSLVITQSLKQHRRLTKDKWDEKFICFGANGAFLKSYQLYHSDVTSSKGKTCSLHGEVTLYVWSITQILLGKFCLTCQWWPSWRICVNHYTFIFQAPLNNIWNSISSLKLWKQ